MSEPRRLNTGDGTRTVYHAGDARTVNTRHSAAGGMLNQEEYETERRRAQAAAAGNSRRTRSFARVQQSDIDRYQAARQQPAAPARSAPAPAAQTAPNGAAAQPMTTAQRQAMELQRRAAAGRSGTRTVNRSAAAGAQVRHLDLNETRAARAHYDMNDDPDYQALHGVE